MALEGFAALGVASNIVQFVEFGCRLFSHSKELYRSSSGLANEAVELENITRSLVHLSDRLVVENAGWNQPPLHDSGIEPEDDSDVDLEDDGEADLTLIARNGKKIADELSDALNQLRVKDSGKKWQCFRMALKRVWKPKKIDDMSRRMERLSSQLTMCLVKSLK